MSVDSTSKPPEAKKASKKVTPQQSIDNFWEKFVSKYPGKPFQLLPNSLDVKCNPNRASRNLAISLNAAVSYEAAATICRAKVERIVQECRRLNQKYSDADFDIENDFMKWRRSERIERCLVALDKDSAEFRPMSVKRVEDIFDKPRFYIDGITASNVLQGHIDDCWLMSAIGALGNRKDLLERVCCARDEIVGVYGFVFHRDGEWVCEIIDDKLYLAKADFYGSEKEKQADWFRKKRTDPDDEYQKVMQKGSSALYFAQCRNENETWLPLLQKAYAKAHGDYSALEGGSNGEGLEDLTGGITTELHVTDIVDKDKFWVDNFMNVNKMFLFGLWQPERHYDERRGIISDHSYSILEAKELDGLRLLKVQNPWGEKPWNGPWSDGSKEWTPDRMSRLDHRFNNDGASWILYEDVLKHFQFMDRTRFFGAEWSTTQLWTYVEVPWSIAYPDTRFKVSVSKAGPMVMVLSQLDDRYFRGLRGQYYFSLHFDLHMDGEVEHISRTKPTFGTPRSVAIELDLEAGQYLVTMNITASRYKSAKTPEEVVQETSDTRPDKLYAVGLSYEFAHARCGFKGRTSELETRRRREKHKQKKAKIKKAFEAKKLANRREVLKRLRLEAHIKAKKGDEKGNEKSVNTQDGIEISIKAGGQSFKPINNAGADKAVREGEGNIQRGTMKQFKITVEASDNDNIKKIGDQTDVNEGRTKENPSEDNDSKIVTAIGSGMTSGEESPSSGVRFPSPGADEFTISDNKPIEIPLDPLLTEPMGTAKALDTQLKNLALEDFKFTNITSNQLPTEPKQNTNIPDKQIKKLQLQLHG